MAISRRDVMRGAAASAPVLAFLEALPAAAADFDPKLLITPRAAWREVQHVNGAMGPTRLTGSPEHQRFTAWLKAELDHAVRPAGGRVFTEAFDNYPRWTAKSWSLVVGGKPVPVASYFPYCTGGFTGARLPVTPASALAAPGGGGSYPPVNGRDVVALDPNGHAEGTLVDLGVFTGPRSIDWTKAAGKLALVAVSVPDVAGAIPPGAYKVDSTWEHGRPNAGPYISLPAPTASIFAPPDIDQATRAGVLGVVLIWRGISDGNAEGQYNPFTARSRPRPPQARQGPNRPRPRRGFRPSGSMARWALAWPRRRRPARRRPSA